MSKPWNELPGLTPEDAAEVWVRRGWYGSPWIATWSATAQTFTSRGGIICPWWVIWRWRIK